MDHQYLRYVGVTGFISHVLQPLQIRCTERNLCCISKSSMMKYEPKNTLSLTTAAAQGRRSAYGSEANVWGPQVEG